MRVYGRSWFALIPLLMLSCQPKEDKSADPTGSDPRPGGIKLNHPQAQVIHLKQKQPTSHQVSYDVPAVNTYREEFNQQIERNGDLIDILVIVDNSGSMGEEQSNLANNMQPLLSQIQHKDWQINVITTDSPCPTTNMLPLNAQTQNLEAEYRRAIQTGVNGSGHETGMQKVREHLEGRCGGSGWLRQDATLAMVFISDENDHSSTSPEGFISYLEQRGYSAGDNFIAYALIHVPGTECSTAAEQGLKYQALVEATEGVSGSVCSDDYSATLEEISGNLGGIFNIRLTLANRPLLENLRVTIDGRPYNGTIAIAGHSIILLSPILNPRQFIVEYQTTRFDEVTLPEPGTEIQVYLDQEPLSQQHYRLMPDRQTIQMLRALPGLSTVTVEYKRLADLNERFVMPRGITGRVECFVDKHLVPTHYRADEGWVVLFPNLLSGQEAVCLYSNQ